MSAVQLSEVVPLLRVRCSAVSTSVVMLYVRCTAVRTGVPLLRVRYSAVSTAVHAALPFAMRVLSKL